MQNNWCFVQSHGDDDGDDLIAETKKEMDEMQAKMNVQSQIPDMSEIITSLWGGGPVPVRRQQR